MNGEEIVSEPNCHTTKFFAETLLTIEMRKTQILMNKPVYLSWSILDLSKTVMYEFWCDYVKPKYGEKDLTLQILNNLDHSLKEKIKI